MGMNDIGLIGYSDYLVSIQSCQLTGQMNTSTNTTSSCFGSLIGNSVDFSGNRTATLTVSNVTDTVAVVAQAWDVGIIGTVGTIIVQISSLNATKAFTMTFFDETAVVLGENRNSTVSISQTKITANIAITGGNLGPGLLMGDVLFTATITVTSVQANVSVTANTKFGAIVGNIEVGGTLLYNVNSFQLNTSIRCIGGSTYVAATIGSISGCQCT